MPIKRITYSAFLILFLLSFYGSVSGQQKKTNEDKTVCSAKIPSRASMISSSQKAVKSPADCSKKNLSCCKGASSRLTALASSATKPAKPVNKNPARKS